MQALILAGGSGTRFWPLSRRRRPKQLLALDGAASLLRQTCDRLAPAVMPDDVWVVTTRALRDEVFAELPDVPEHQVLAEPEGRNTAPAIAWAVRSMPPERRRQAIAVLPADHRIGDVEAFRRALTAAGRAAADDDRVLALGVTPRWAETGYGYLEQGASLDGAAGLRRVVRFTEKPDLETAERFVASGDYLWNAGIFVFRGTTLLALVERHLPELAAGLEELAASPGRLDDIYPRLPRVSIDYGVMEQLSELATLPLDAEWSDLGSWQALAEVLPADAAGNVCRGATVAVDAGGNLLFADQGLVAALGVHGLVVVRTGDAVLVVPRERSQDVRLVVDRLAAEGRGDLL